MFQRIKNLFKPKLIAPRTVSFREIIRELNVKLSSESGEPNISAWNRFFYDLLRNIPNEVRDRLTTIVEHESKNKVVSKKPKNKGAAK